MISGIILASGFSKRMGYDKLFAEIKGESIIESVIKAAVSSSLNEIILVYRDKRLEALCKKYGVKNEYNEKAFYGQSEAVKKGLKKCRKETEGYLFIMGDQPFLTPSAINKILNHSALYPNNIIIPLYDKKRGNPVFFPVIFKEDLLDIEGDKGGSSVILKNSDKTKYVEINPPYIGWDIDSKEDLDKAENVTFYSITV